MHESVDGGREFDVRSLCGDVVRRGPHPDDIHDVGQPERQAVDEQRRVGRQPSLEQLGETVDAQGGTLDRRPTGRPPGPVCCDAIAPFLVVWCMRRGRHVRDTWLGRQQSLCRQ